MLCILSICIEIFILKELRSEFEIICTFEGQVSSVSVKAISYLDTIFNLRSQQFTISLRIPFSSQLLTPCSRSFIYQWEIHGKLYLTRARVHVHSMLQGLHPLCLDFCRKEIFSWAFSLDFLFELCFGNHWNILGS